MRQFAWLLFLVQHVAVTGWPLTSDRMKITCRRYHRPHARMLTMELDAELCAWFVTTTDGSSTKQLAWLHAQRSRLQIAREKVTRINISFKHSKHDFRRQARVARFSAAWRKRLRAETEHAANTLTDVRNTNTRIWKQTLNHK